MAGSSSTPAISKKAGAKQFWRFFFALLFAGIVLWLLYTVSISVRTAIANKVPGATA